MAITLTGQTTDENHKFTLCISTDGSGKWSGSEPLNASHVMRKKKGKWLQIANPNAVRLETDSGDPVFFLKSFKTGSARVGDKGTGNAFHAGADVTWMVTKIN